MSVKRLVSESTGPSVGIKRSLHDNCEASGLRLIRAAGQGNTEEVERLLSQDSIQVDKEDAKGFTALAIASARGHLQIVELLLKVGNVDVVWNRRIRPFHLAAQNGHLAVLKAFMERPEIVNWSHGNTLSHLNSNLINSCDLDGHSPLHLAAQNGHLEVVQFLIERGAEQFEGCAKDTPLYLAAESGQVGVVQLLLRHEMGTNSRKDCLSSALNQAAINGHEEVVAVLLKHDWVDVNAQSAYHSLTPLHLAAREGRDEVLRVLLADRRIQNLKDEFGKTALDLAKEGGYSSCAQIIKNRFGH